MPRRGWSALETPASWYQVIRGPRPKSEASTAASSPTMAPWAVRWHPTKSRRNGGQRTVASGAVAECTGFFGRVRVCSCERLGCSVAASSARSSSTAIGSAIRRVSGFHQAFPKQVVPSGARTHRRTRSSGRGIGTVGKDPPRDAPNRECCLSPFRTGPRTLLW